MPRTPYEEPRTSRPKKKPLAIAYHGNDSVDNPDIHSLKTAKASSGDPTQRKPAPPSKAIAKKSNKDFQPKKGSHAQSRHDGDRQRIPRVFTPSENSCSGQEVP
ncbi:hypothetical protein ABVK25_001553 [Lepraria finkii]|uniref:Uncharacterized protein n=1 Tax=Lepraria finkii TaxID=1340010 RepID=A0ABR4BLM6_9LECA